MSETFAIAPASSKALYFLVPVIVFAFAALSVALVALGSAAFATTRTRFEVSTDGLHIRGGEVMWKSFVPRAALDARSARRVDFQREPELRPTRRTMGTALPGYAGGWFRLENGQKALVYLTDRTNAVLIPTRENYVVLVSPQDPDGLVRALHAQAP